MFPALIMILSFLFVVIAIYILFLLRERERDLLTAFDPRIVSPAAGGELQADRAAELAYLNAVTNDYSWIRTTDSVLRRIKKIIAGTHRRMALAAAENDDIPTAAEWLLDNNYILETQIKEIKESLWCDRPAALPTILSGKLKGYTRIQTMAAEMVRQNSGSLDENTVLSYVKAYKTGNPLNEAELKMLPCMIRFSLIEQIASVCLIIDEIFASREMAVKCFNAMKSEGFSEKEFTGLFSGGTHPDSEFVERMLYLLKKPGNIHPEAACLFNEYLVKMGIDRETAAHSAHTSQSSVAVIMGNCILSLRQMNAFEWTEAVECLSVTEEILREDPNHSYSAMDSETRAFYRSEIAEISNKSNVSELHTAKTIIRLAREHGGEPASSHVGWYLFDKGREKLFNEPDYKESCKEKLYAACKKHPLTFYLSLAFIFTILIYLVSALINSDMPAEHYGHPAYLLILVLSIIPVSNGAIYMTNRLIGKLFRPRALFRMDFSESIPEEYSTLVAIPSLMPDKEKAEEMIARLETHYLSNNKENVYFLLMGDFKDADMQHTDEDKEIVEVCMDGVAALNKRYCPEGRSKFIYFHRYRTYNKKQKKWIGYERKRGGLAMLNKLLLTMKSDGSLTTDSFEIRSTQELPFSNIKYIITLDADTLMPHNTVYSLIGAMAHPLNRPVLNNSGTGVKRGYSLLQPRVICDAESAGATPFSTIFTGEAGMDMYTGAVSDVYQDLFGEGIFTGKGIYDLQMFQTVLGKAIPEDTVLSHDLLEGSYVRAGLDTGNVFVDNYPSNYGSFCTRLHRWIRGDWQLAGWLKYRIPLEDGSMTENPLPTSGQWKIIDNLRRSLLAPAVFLSILLSLWMGNWFWCIFSILMYTAPIVLSAAGAAIRRVCHPFAFKHRLFAPGGGNDLIQIILNIVFLPHQAYMIGGAICKTIIRMAFTRKNMLEWVTAAEAEKNAKGTIIGYFSAMKIPLLLTGLWGAAVIHANYRIPSGSYVIGGYVFLFLMWLGAPFMAYYTGLKYEKPTEKLSEEQLRELHGDARKIWRFFETFSNRKNSYLPPDNFQEEPPRGIAARTSPTNIGLGLLANLAANDLGFISPEKAVTRCERMMDSIDRLEKWNGHLLNWYSTADLSPLRPSYVSTVDSGNFICSLIALKEGLAELKNAAIIDMKYVEGLADTMALRGENTATPKNMRLLQELGDISESAAEKGEGDRKREIWTTTLYQLSEQLKNSADSVGRNDKAVEQTGDLIHYAGYNRNEMNNRIDILCRRIEEIIFCTDFGSLYSQKHRLLSIGFDMETGKLTNSFYDLFATEARQASFIAIASGGVPPKHWNRPGRTQVSFGGRKGPVSWTGTMFEYLMPALLMKTYRNTLSDEACRFAVHSQKLTGKNRKRPWGVSECAFYMVDSNKDYQYKAMGIPELGLKRGLADDYAVSPYSVFLALEFDPVGAFNNLKTLKREQMDGPFGMYEAADYTSLRLPAGRKKGIVRSFMAHHQGMSLLAVSNILCDYNMQKRFHRSGMVRSADLLLHEKISKAYIKPVRNYEKKAGDKAIRVSPDKRNNVLTFTKPGSPPLIHFLSNGDYTVMLTDCGGGYSEQGERYLTRWRTRECDKNGIRIYLKDIDTQRYHEAADPDLPGFKGVFSPGRAMFRQSFDNLETQYDITVVPDENAEIRAVTIKNKGRVPRTVEVTSYLEVTLTSLPEDTAHPAFSSLFLQTSYDEKRNILYAVRKPRVAKDSDNTGDGWYRLGMTCVLEGRRIGRTEIETDRFKFLGRGGDIANPKVLNKNVPLSGSLGSVIAPVLCMRNTVSVLPGQSVKVSFIVAGGSNKSEVEHILHKPGDPRSIRNVFRMAAENGRLENYCLRARPEDIDNWLRLASYPVFADYENTGNRREISQNQKGLHDLWMYGISGDNPIIAATADDISEVREIVKMHDFWRGKGLITDLVIIIKEEANYMRPLYNAIRELTTSGNGGDLFGKNGGVHLLAQNTLPEEDRVLILACAKLIYENGIVRKGENIPKTECLPDIAEIKEKSVCTHTVNEGKLDTEELIFFNGYGGFNVKTGEYHIMLTGDAMTPLPWSYVVANENFGFLATESGGGYTWSINSREFKLTPWSNDPVSDTTGEMLFLHNVKEDIYHPLMPYNGFDDHPGCRKIIYGKGYVIYEGETNGISHKVTVYVPDNIDGKVSIIETDNIPESESYEVVAAVAPVMGVDISATSNYLVASAESLEYISVQNRYNTDFSGMEMYLMLGDRCRSDYRERKPVKGHIMLSTSHSGKTVFIMGAGEISAREESIHKLRKLSDPAEAHRMLEETSQLWSRRLGVVEVETPDEAFNTIMNGRLTYQTIACRLNARTAFYQAGGAIGFRDQLQDSVSMLQINPMLCREQILLCCSRQFPEGDVQHWWHPPQGKGTRTRITDDLVWLPYAVVEYIEVTGDDTILKEEVQFIDAPVLDGDEHERYVSPIASGDTASVYEHCLRAIRRANRTGPRGIPVIGGGDWNDGMNMVGPGGVGESVWLGWFLIYVMKKFSAISAAYGDTDVYGELLGSAESIRSSIEEWAWDGNWYIRAWFDDGKPLGSIQCDECRIDAISQSWSVISEAGNSERQETAMLSTELRLVDYENGLIRLLEPPFDTGNSEPGYIRGYLPGVRENGGQYSHAAAWTIMAFALLGRKKKAEFGTENGNHSDFFDKAWELFSMINPINHTRTDAECMKYKGEPYVMSADVYSVNPNAGRAGWTWYTGSSGWMYRVGLEYLLGIKRRGEKLLVEPCLPSGWEGCRIKYQYANTEYKITIKKGNERKIFIDGKAIKEPYIALIADAGKIEVDVFFRQ